MVGGPIKPQRNRRWENFLQKVTYDLFSCAAWTEGREITLFARPKLDTREGKSWVPELMQAYPCARYPVPVPELKPGRGNFSSDFTGCARII